MNKKMAISLIIGLVISGVAMYFSFRNIPFNDLVAYLKTIQYLWLIPATAIVILSYAVRAVRWRILAGPVANLGYAEAFNLTMTGFMLNCILPARMGEIVRPAALMKNHGVPFPAGVATVIAERIFDMIFLIIFMAVCLSTVNISPDINYTYKEYTLNRATLEAVASGMVKLCIVFVAIIIAVCFEKSRNLISRLIHLLPKISGFAGEKFASNVQKFISNPIDNALHNIASGFQSIKRYDQMLMCLFLSFLVWALLALSYYVFAQGCPGMDLSLLEISAVMVIICFVIALPSAPGFWGIWEAGSIFAVTIFGVSADQAAGYSLANHALQIFPVIIVGIFSALSIGFGTKLLDEAEALAEEK